MAGKLSGSPVAGEMPAPPATADHGLVLEIRDAAKRFGSVVALRGAHLTLRAGEWLALLGPNGAGKTTLVRTVAGRVVLDAGDVTLLGERLARGAANGPRRELGVVPQELALYPALTARENLQTFSRFLGLGGATLRQRVDWALQWTGLSDRAGEPVKRFSGGMKRRLNIACGVLHRPRVVLLDEPTVGVDPQSRQRIWEMLGELRHDGASLLLTTHQLDEAQQVAERITIIDHGRTIASGRFDELVAATIGGDRTVTLVLDRAPPAGLDARFERDAAGGALRCRVRDVAGELPALLASVGAAGCRVQDVRVEGPTLQAVFLHLTGRELRE